MRGGLDTAWHLYNIKEDKREGKDLPDEYSDKVKDLNNLWENWAGENHIYPKPNSKKLG